MCDQPVSSAFFANFRGPLPWTRKLQLAARNMWTKVRTRQTCCGHPGEPAGATTTRTKSRPITARRAFCRGGPPRDSSARSGGIPS